MNKIFKGILADCLRESIDGYVINALVTEFPNIQDFVNAKEEEMRRIKGIGKAKAKQLQAILNFVKAVNKPIINPQAIIRSPDDVYQFVHGNMEYLQVEHFVVLGLSTKNHVLFKETISIGTLNASVVHPRETFRSLIKKACASCILVHNHPSGNASPSAEDIAITKTLVEAGNIIGIKVIDHVIIGIGEHVSLKERGVI